MLPKLLTIQKFDPSGRLMHQWDGEILTDTASMRKVSAKFSSPDISVGQVRFCQGDHFIETYYSNHWFNIFEVWDHRSDTIKAWYCNIAEPARFTNESILWTDLSLDVIIYPDGNRELLDLDEFALLKLDYSTQRECWNAVQQLINGSVHKQGPSIFNPFPTPTTD